MAAPDVEHLLPGVRRGETAALEALIRALADPLYRYAERVTGDPGAAEDIVQDTFIRVYRRRGKLDAGGTLRGYCYRAATNLAFNHIRNRRKRSAREAEAAAMNKAPDPEYAAMAREAWRLAGELPDEIRATLHLRYAHGLSLAETAQAMQVPEGTVSTRQRTGLQKLRDRLAMTAVLVPGWELESALQGANPAVPASIGLERRVEAAVMTSVGAKSAFNVAVLAAAALLLLLGGASAAWVFLVHDAPQPKIAEWPSPVEEVEEPAPQAPVVTESPPDEVVKVPKEAPKPEEPADEVDRLGLLRQLKAHYLARDERGFAETAEKCKAAQPWEFEILLPFFGEVVNGEFKRWQKRFEDPRTGRIVMVDSSFSGAELTLERTIISLAMGRVALEEDSAWLCAKAREWILKTAASNPQVEAGKAQQFGGMHNPVNPDAEALGVFAAELLNHCGYEASRAFVASIFSYVKNDDALRWGLIQIGVCRAIGATKLSAAADAVDQLYIAAERASVKHAAFLALIQIKGEGFAAAEAERILELVPFNKSGREAKASFKARLELFVVACPSGEMMLTLLDNVMAMADEPGSSYLLGVSEDLMHRLDWRRYRLVDPRDEKLLMLQHFDKTKLLGVVKALSYELGEVYSGTNDAYAKRVLADKIDDFEENGWAGPGPSYTTTAFTSLMFAYCKVPFDPAESLLMILDVWYPRHHSWGIKSLDRALTNQLQFHLARTIAWGPTHERAFDALCQRIEGTGSLAYSGRMADTKDIADACAYVPFLQMKQLLIDRIQTTQDAEARKVYEGALEAWKKRHEK